MTATTMANIVFISDDPNSQLAVVQQLVSQLSIGGGNPVTINVVNNHVVNNNGDTVNGDTVNNNDNSNNDNSKNILTKEYFDEKLKEVLTELKTGQTEILHSMRLNYEVRDGFKSFDRYLLMIQIRTTRMGLFDPLDDTDTNDKG